MLIAESEARKYSFYAHANIHCLAAQAKEGEGFICRARAQA
jgi:hypothetical protein